MAEPVIIDLRVNSKKAQDSLNKTARVGKQAAKEITTGFNNTTSALKVMQGVLGAGVIIAGVRAVTNSIIDLGKTSLAAASDAEETGSKFATVFQDIATEAENTAVSLADNFGLATTAAKKLLGDTGDLLTGFGFTQESALDLSKQVQELAVDLASFTNFSGGAEGASAALTKALLGERESVKSLGISILEEDVKKQVAINTANGLTFATNRQAKAQATLDIAIRQSTNAIGDYSRTSGSYANQQRVLDAVIQDVKETIGEELLPIMTELTKSFISTLREYKPLIKSFTSSAIVEFKVTIESLVLAFRTLKAAMSGSYIEAFKLDQLFSKTAPTWLKISAAIAGIAVITKTVVTGLAFLKTIALAATAATTAFGTSLAATATATAILGESLFAVGGLFSALGAAIAAAFAAAPVTVVAGITAALAGLSYAAYSLYDAFTDTGEKIKEVYSDYTGLIIPLRDARSEMTKNSDVMFAQLGILEEFSNYDDELIKKIKIEADTPTGGSLLPSQIIELDKAQAASVIAAKEAADKKVAIRKAQLEEIRNLQLRSDIVDRENATANAQWELEQAQANNEVNLEVYKDQNAVKFAALQDAQTAQLEAVLAFELEKANLETEASAKADKIKKANDTAKLKRSKLVQKQLLADAKFTADNNKKYAELEIQQQNSILSSTATFLTLGSELAKQGSRERKALAISAALINTYVAANIALASVPPPANYVAMAATIATGLANVANITSTGNYAQGGFIPGRSLTGDKLTANVNSGEVVLNSQQQKNFMDVANGESSNTGLIDSIKMLASRPINVEVDGQVIASVVRDQIADGFVLGAS